MIRRMTLGWLVVLLVAGGCATDSTADVATSAPTTTQPATTTAAPTTTLAPTTTSTTTTAAPTTTTTTIATPEPVPIADYEGYELVWNDEFDGDEIDPTNWTYDIGGWGWGNGEAQYYTDRPENARVENGLLVVEARFERFENAYYTSARLKTEDLREFQYGKFEARIKVPEGNGLWPAFWMLGTAFERDEANPTDSNWPFAGEIDIMEYVGREPNKVFGTVHGPGYAGALGLGKWNPQDFPIADDWHTYGIEWDTNSIRWFFDGEEYGEVDRELVGDREWVFDQPFFFLINLALGGTFPGPIGFDVEFPKFLYVDFVRVYQRVGEGSG